MSENKFFTCKRCNLNFSNKFNLKSHLQRKTPCQFIDVDYDRKILISELYQRNLNEKTFDCEYCNKKFNHTSTKAQHKKTCKSKPLDKITILENIVNTLVEDNKLLKAEINNNLKKNRNIVSNINNTNTQINNNLSINGVKIRDFGRENMEALPESLISSLFLDLRFRELLANLHCDPNYPENQNVRIKSVKRNTMEIFRNNKWDIMTFTKGLNELLLQGHKIFKDYYKNDKERILKEDMTECELREILDQLDKIENLNKNEIKPLIEDIQMMLEEFKLSGSAIVLV